MLSLKRGACLVCLTQLFTVTAATGNIIRIPQDYPTIQQGINVAVNGDTVLVGAGTYVENVNFSGKAILVASNYILTGDSTVISATTIDGGRTGSAVRFISGEDSTSRIVGFTIRNGSGYNGGGVYCSGSSPVLSRLFITDNSAEFGGGGIACQFGSNPAIINCRISANTALYGGGMWVAGSSPVIGKAGNRCNIYANVSTNEYGLGSELYSQSSPLLVVYVDTFSVLNPDEGLIYPVYGFGMNIVRSYYIPIQADTYVSPTGDNNHDGLTPATPFRNIWFAILRTVGSPAQPHTIHLLPGTYSSALTGERTLQPRSHVSLVGEDSSTTFIDGDGERCVIYCYRDSSLTILHLTIRNGSAFQGAGIYCEQSKPTISGNVVMGNGNTLHGSGTGGGIFCTENSSPTIVGNRITSNVGYGISCTFNSEATIIGNVIMGSLGGNITCSDFSSPTIAYNQVSGDSLGFGSGISCERNASPNIVGNVISNNHSSGGAGISCLSGSNPNILSNVISDNIVYHGGDAGMGGAILCSSSNPQIDSNLIIHNVASGAVGALGGAIFCSFSNPVITRNQIIGNSAIGNTQNVSALGEGGGIYIENSQPVIGGSIGNGNVFHDNVALTGADMYRSGGPAIVNAQYNTFDIYPLSSYYVFPASAFNLSNGVGTRTAIAQDVYVAPSGSNQNDGVTPQTPFLNIRFALSRILPLPASPLTVHLAPGTYSPSTTGEVFPLSLLSYASVLGRGADSTILDAEYSNRVVYCFRVDSLSISRLRIQKGKAASGGGLYCETANPIIHDNIITADSADWGSGIYCTRRANPTIANNIITRNATIGLPYWYKFGSVFVNDSSHPLIINNVIAFNRSHDGGAGISCNLSSPSIVNNTISNNEAEDEGGGVLCWNNSSPIIRNNIVWGNVAPIDSSIRLCCGSSPVVSYSNVQGGWDGVGNRNTDPLFADSTHFHLSSASPCIDAGNPSPNFNDPEDPLNPGFALFPAMGTLRNDMGTYGGPGTTGQLPVDVREPERETHLPVSFVLCQNYPNPFNPSTMIQFSLPQAEFVTLKVFNMLGQEITTLVSKDLSAGTYKTEWNAQALPSGIYFYRLQTGTFCQTRKLVLLR